MNDIVNDEFWNDERIYYHEPFPDGWYGLSSEFVKEFYKQFAREDCKIDIDRYKGEEDCGEDEWLILFTVIYFYDDGTADAYDVSISKAVYENSELSIQEKVARTSWWGELRKLR